MHGHWLSNCGLASTMLASCWDMLPWDCPHTLSAAPVVNPPGAVTNSCPPRGWQGHGVCTSALSIGVDSQERGKRGQRAPALPSGHRNSGATPGAGLCLCPLSTSGVPSPILGGFEGRGGTGGILERCRRGWVSAGRGRGSGTVTQAGLTPSDPRMSSTPGSSQALLERPRCSCGCC